MRRVIRPQFTAWILAEFQLLGTAINSQQKPKTKLNISLAAALVSMGRFNIYFNISHSYGIHQKTSNPINNNQLTYFLQLPIMVGPYNEKLSDKKSA